MARDASPPVPPADGLAVDHFPRAIDRDNVLRTRGGHAVPGAHTAEHILRGACLMIVGTIIKQLAERFPASIDFTRRLQTGETFVSATVTAVVRATGVDATNAVLEGTVGFGSGIVTRMLKATIGNDGVDYVLTFQGVTTPGGQVLEDELLLRIIETSIG